MHKFSLSRRKEDSFPTEIDGYAINADFRNILGILRLQSSHEDDRKKIAFMLSFFYIGQQPPSDEAFEIIKQFISGDDSEAAGGSLPQEKTFDFEFDAEEIYASFLRDYQIDLIECGFLHWRKFVLMLNQLSDDSPFKRKVHLRFMDFDEKADARKKKLQEAKRSVQLPIEYTKKELEELEEIYAMLE